MKRQLWIAALLFTQSLFALSTQCFQVEQPEDPAKMPIGDRSQMLNWCYFEVVPARRWFAAQVDGTGSALETSFIVDVDDAGRPSRLIHSSLAFGRRRIYEQTPVEFNPFSVPLTPAQATKARLHIARFTPALSPALESTLSTLISSTRDRVAPMRLDILTEVPADETEQLEASQLPDDGFWWPHQGIPLARGTASPLAKYDAYVKSKTGTNPGAQEWELKYHSLEHVPWGGHCNGWAASAVLYDFAEDILYEPKAGTLIRASDIQGMRAEASFCVNMAFYGKRYRAAPDDMKEITPDRFHQVIRYYIKSLKKPVLMDYFPNEEIDNNIVSGYTFAYSLHTDGRLKVVATLRMHDYNRSRVEKKQVARTYNRRFNYYLTVDATGRITAGEWIGTNPDFLWVPLSQAKCGRENPGIDHDRIEEMRASNDFMKVEYIYKTWNYRTIAEIAPGETLVLEAPRAGGYEPQANASFNIPAEPVEEGQPVPSPKPLRIDFYWKDAAGVESVDSRTGQGQAYANSAKRGKAILDRVEIHNPGAEVVKNATVRLGNLMYYQPK